MKFKLIAFAAPVLITGTAWATSQTIQCHIDDKGRPAAALVWQNTLGVERANRLCEEFSPRQIERPSANVSAGPRFTTIKREVYQDAVPSTPRQHAEVQRVQVQPSHSSAENHKTTSWSVEVPPGYLSLNSPLWRDREAAAVDHGASTLARSNHAVTTAESLAANEVIISPVDSTKSTQAIEATTDHPIAMQTKQQSTDAELRLHGGRAIYEQVHDWSKQAGWRLIWNAPTEWVVSNSIDMKTSDVLVAVDQLALWLSQEGRPIRFTAYETNKVLVADSLEALRSE